jgi:hypothetical protein
VTAVEKALVFAVLQCVEMLLKLRLSDDDRARMSATLAGLRKLMDAAAERERRAAPGRPVPGGFVYDYVAPNSFSVDWNGTPPDVRAIWEKIYGSKATSSPPPTQRPMTFPWWFGELNLTEWPPTREAIAAAFRALALKRHPDQGGTHDGFVRLTKARDEALVHTEGRRA